MAGGPLRSLPDGVQVDRETKMGRTGATVHPKNILVRRLSPIQGPMPPNTASNRA